MLPRLSTKDRLTTTLDYIKKGIDEGGKVLTGGNGDDANGFFIEPTIIDNVAAGRNHRTRRNFRAGFGSHQSARF